MRLKITDQSNLLSVVLDREISDEQARLVRKLIDATETFEEADIERLEEILSPTLWAFTGYDAPAGAGDAVEAYRG